MRSGDMRSFRLAIAGAVLGVTLFPTMPLLRAQAWDLNKTRSVAESQHEIVMILIRKKEFDKAAEEANKIFQMKWPEDQEPILSKELIWFAGQFHRNRQSALAVRLLETNLSMFKTVKSKVAIWKEKGYLLEAMGQHDKALDCFREAQRLEKAGGHP
ncbi:MAG: tetratricopeptide repeat protein [Acidobacteriota bacterium]|jgi:tetratricopeptide (TPR) repeat protein